MSRINPLENGWVLSCPAPTFGNIATGYYNSGSGLADDTVTETDEYSVMQIVSNTTADDFANYSNVFESKGYKCILDNVIGNNLYRQYTDTKTVWHISFIAHKNEIRVTEDVCGVPLSEFAYQADGNAQNTVYQYGLYYDPLNRVTDRAVNCGMFYVIRLCDNSLVLVDAGHIFQASDKTVSDMLTFLHRITGTNDGEKINIAAWYITHAHGDHVSSTAKLFNRFSDQINLERVMYNFPSYQVRSRGYDPLTTTAKEIVRKLYPNVKFLKLHSGMRFNLAGTQFEILYTHEDAVSIESELTYNFRDYNCTSTVMRIHFDNKSVMMLGDISGAAEAVIANNFDGKVLKSDVVQVAHHCFNLLESIYSLVDAPMAFMPNSYYGCHLPDNLPKLEKVLEHLENDQIYYEDATTTGIAVVDGKMSVILSEKIFTEEYDFSGF